MNSKGEQISKAKAELDAIKNLESSKLKAVQDAKNKIAEDKAKAFKAEQEAKEQEAKEQEAKEQEAKEQEAKEQEAKIKKGEFLNPLKKGVSYDFFLEALGTKTVSEYCKGKLTEKEINWITNEIKIYKSIKTKK